MTIPDPLRSGATVLGGRYRLVRLLGEGGMGVVWEALDVERRAPCAIKFLREGSDHEAFLRFMREAEAAQAVVHPNVVGIFSVEAETNGAPAIVMELLRGESLRARLERLGPLPAGQTAAILACVAAGVEAAHRMGLVHRDLKPDNVFLCAQPDGTTLVKVLDFGIAKPMAAVSERALTVTGVLVGTPQYMSPEQAGGERDLDARADVWSLAVIAFECLTGRVPLTGENYGQILSKLIRLDIEHLADAEVVAPLELVDAIDGCLVPRRLRPASIGELGHVFARHADPTIAPPPAPVATTTDPPPATHPTAMTAQTLARSPAPARTRWLVAFGALATLGIVAGSLALRGRAPSRGQALATSEPAAVTTITTPPPAASSLPASPVAAPVASAAPAETSAPPPKPSVRASSAARPAPSARGAPVRLQGGVAGGIPF